jgi:hypothetical protein
VLDNFIKGLQKEKAMANIGKTGNHVPTGFQPVKPIPSSNKPSATSKAEEVFIPHSKNLAKMTNNQDKFKMTKEKASKDQYPKETAQTSDKVAGNAIKESVKNYF